MPTKRTSIPRASNAKVKSSGFSTQVLVLDSCLAADQAKLPKIYRKLLSNVDKAIVRKAQELKKAKLKAKPIKSTKGKAQTNLLKTKVAATGLNTLEKR